MGICAPVTPLVLHVVPDFVGGHFYLDFYVGVSSQFRIAHIHVLHLSMIHTIFSLCLSEFQGSLDGADTSDGVQITLVRLATATQHARATVRDVALRKTPKPGH